MTQMDDAQRQSLTSKEMLMTQHDTRNGTTGYSDNVADIITMLKELGFDYDKDVSLHRNPLSDQRVLGALRTAFNEVDEADREMEGPQIADLEKMAMTGNVEWGSSVGNIFNREHKKGSEASRLYNGDRSYDAKRQFRKAWAQQKLIQKRKEKKFSKSYTEVDVRHGTYRCLGHLIEQFGIFYDRRRAEAIGIRWAMKCTLLGGRWTYFDPMVEQVMYLHLERQYNEGKIQ